MIGRRLSITPVLGDSLHKDGHGFIGTVIESIDMPKFSRLTKVFGLDTTPEK